MHAFKALSNPRRWALVEKMMPNKNEQLSKIYLGFSIQAQNCWSLCLSSRPLWLNHLTFFESILLTYSLHTTKCTHFQCRVPPMLGSVHTMQPSLQSRFKHFCHLQSSPCAFWHWSLSPLPLPGSHLSAFYHWSLVLPFLGCQINGKIDILQYNRVEFYLSPGLLENSTGSRNTPILLCSGKQLSAKNTPPHVI